MEIPDPGGETEIPDRWGCKGSTFGEVTLVAIGAIGVVGLAILDGPKLPALFIMDLSAPPIPMGSPTITDDVGLIPVPTIDGGSSLTGF